MPHPSRSFPLARISRPRHLSPQSSRHLHNPWWRASLAPAASRRAVHPSRSPGTIDACECRWHRPFDNQYARLALGDTVIWRLIPLCVTFSAGIERYGQLYTLYFLIDIFSIILLLQIFVKTVKRMKSVIFDIRLFSSRRAEKTSVRFSSWQFIHSFSNILLISLVSSGEFT